MVSCLHLKHPRRLHNLFLVVVFYLFTHTVNSAYGLEAAQLAVIVNELDPQSLAVARYYQASRAIPVENMIYVAFNPNGVNMDVDEFSKLHKMIVANTLNTIKAYAITWTEPYRVGCMSMTSAITFGFNKAYCAKGCAVTKKSPFYVDYSTDEPQREINNVNPISMMLAGISEKQVKSLIDRGKRTSLHVRKPQAFLLQSRDKNRNVQAKKYRQRFGEYQGNIETHYKKKSFLVGEKNILYYSVGLTTVPYLGRNTFLPGAIGEHLTSAGGMLTDSYQMSILRWLEAGATASYGTVVEPCNFTEKFSNPLTLLASLERGDSVIEAYWKSVSMPGQGVFVGEPLATPLPRQDLFSVIVNQ